MQLGRCPTCHSRIDLEAMIQDGAASALLSVLAKLDSRLGSALVAYLGLFRPGKSDLSFSRASRLATEVLALHADPQVLRTALEETLASLEEKRRQPSWKKLSNHNYLERVLESVALRPSTSLVRVDKEPQGAVSASERAFDELESLR